MVAAAEEEGEEGEEEEVEGGGEGLLMRETESCCVLERRGKGGREGEGEDGWGVLRSKTRRKLGAHGANRTPHLVILVILVVLVVYSVLRYKLTKVLLMFLRPAAAAAVIFSLEA